MEFPSLASKLLLKPFWRTTMATPPPPGWMTNKEMQELAARHGLTMAPPDHPVFSEGPSIVFSFRMRERPAAKESKPPPTDTPQDSA